MNTISVAGNILILPRIQIQFSEDRAKPTARCRYPKLRDNLQAGSPTTLNSGVGQGSRREEFFHRHNVRELFSYMSFLYK